MSMENDTDCKDLELLLKNETKNMEIIKKKCPTEDKTVIEFYEKISK